METRSALPDSTTSAALPYAMTRKADRVNGGLRKEREAKTRLLELDQKPDVRG